MREPIRPEDLVVQARSAGSHYHVRVTHIPTGITTFASGEGYLRVKAEALRKLEGRAAEECS